VNENEITKLVLDTAFRIHSALGPGLLETVYETLMEWELKQQGLLVQRQHPIPVIYKETRIADGFRADLIVQRKVIVEIKSLELVPKVAYKILLTYLRLSDIRLGLLINFGEASLKDGVKRVVNNL